MTKSNKSNLTNIIFLVTILAITIFLVVFVFITIGKPFVIKDFDDIKTVSVDNYKTCDKKHSEYYVLVYNFDENKDEQIKEIVLAYANFARTTADAKPIYILDYKKNHAIVNANNLNITSANLSSKLPALVLVKDGAVSSSDTKNSISTINQALTTAMNE